jgi:hypothetical protein
VVVTLMTVVVTLVVVGVALMVVDFSDCGFIRFGGGAGFDGVSRAQRFAFRALKVRQLPAN